MKHTKQQAKKFLRVILATKDTGHLVPFVGGRIAGTRARIANLKPRASISTLLGGLTDFEGWDGSIKVPAGSKVSQPIKGYLTLKGTTLLIYSDKAPMAVRDHLEDYFVIGLRQQVPWRDAGGEELADPVGKYDQDAQQSPPEEQLLSEISENEFDGIVASVKHGSNEAAPTATLPEAPQATDDTETVRRPPDAAPEAPALVPEGSGLTSQVIGAVAEHLPSLGVQASGGTADLELLNNWLRRGLPDWPAAEREKRLSTMGARLVLQLPLVNLAGDDGYFVKLMDAAASAAGTLGETPPFARTRKIQLASIGSDTLNRHETAQRFFEEARLLEQEKHAMLDTRQMTSKPVESFVNRNWKETDPSQEVSPLRQIGNLRGELLRILDNSEKALGALLGSGGKMLPPEEQLARFRDIATRTAEVLDGIRKALRTLMAEVENFPPVKENGGIRAMGGNWDQVDAILEALLVINLSDLEERFLKDPSVLYKTIQDMKHTLGALLTSPSAKQIESAPLPGAPTNFFASSLNEFNAAFRHSVPVS